MSSSIGIQATNIAKFSTADLDYTRAQRRLIDARLSESEEDLKHMKTYGPFSTAADMIAHMKAAIKKHPTAAKRKGRGCAPPGRRAVR